MKLSLWLSKTQQWLKNLSTVRSAALRKKRLFNRTGNHFAEVMEQRLLLTGSGTNDPSEFFYSLTSSAHLYNSDQSSIWADDSDIVKLTIEPDGSWQHEMFFDGSDVGLNHWEEDIDAFTIRDDGSLLISTLGCVNVSGVQHSAGGDILKFTPSSIGRHTAGSWEVYVDGSDVGLSHSEGIDAISELSDGSLVISTQRNSYLPGIGSVRDEDISRLALSSTGSHTRGSWSRYFDGSDVGLQNSGENIDGVSVIGDDASIQISTSGTAIASGLYAHDEDIFEFDVAQLGSQTSGNYLSKLALNGSRAGIASSYDIDAFHAAVGDPANPKPPVIDAIDDQTIDEQKTFRLTPTATDPDTNPDSLKWSLVAGPSASMIDETTGEFKWTPQESDGPGTFEVTVAVSDGELSDTETFLVVVNEVNTAPELTAIQDQTVSAGATVLFDAEASDSDFPANSLVYSISGEVPAGADFNTSTGEFTWATSNTTDARSYFITVSVSDGELTDSQSFSIAVNQTGLQVNPIDDQTVDELALFGYQVVATGTASRLSNIDFEDAGGLALNAGDIITDQFSAWGIQVTTDDPERHPAMIFDSSNPTGHDDDLGTPNQKFGGPGIGHGGKSGRWKNDVARQNILIISEDGDSSDPDDNARGGTLIFDFDVPTDIDDIRLLDVDSGRNTIRLYDAAGQLIGSKNIPRRGNNSVQLHVLDAQGVSKMEVNFAGSGAITDLVFDRDGQGQTGGQLTYALNDNAPQGMTISNTGFIDWTPTEAQGPGTYDVDVLVSDGTTTVTETFQITVAEVNVAPTIAPIADQVIDELVEFSYQVTATDPDLPANTLTYSLSDTAPSGMVINSAGLINWTPSEAQGEGNYPIGVLVSDGTSTARVDFQVNVREVNTAPVINTIGNVEINELELFELQVQATDVDLPTNTLTFALGEGAPQGMSMSESGLIQWTPTEAQGEGVYSVSVVVSDGIEEASEDFTVTVGEVNLAPVIQGIGDQTINELTPFELQVQATDNDLPTNTLTYSLASGTPSGMTISENGLINWTPSEQQGPNLYPITVHVSDGAATSSESFGLTVNEVNSAPVLSEVDLQVIDEEQSLTLQLSAVDADLPANDLTYSLIGTPPAGMSVDADGLLTWTPDESQGPQAYSVTVEVSDGELTDSKTFTITVNEVNRAPEIVPIADVQHPELVQFGFQVEASDSDLPASALSYELISPVPVGMSIDGSGLISWTPTEAQGPDSYQVNVQVSDGELTDIESFNLSVTEQNLPPVLSPVGSQTVFPGSQLTFRASATDIDLPLNTLVYSIAGNVPAGAMIDSQSGIFTWDVPANANLGQRVVTITVDDQNGGLDSETLSITVEGPAISTITLTEDDRFETTAAQAITVPAGASYFEFDILNLSFDTDTSGRISDAFEVALLDADGNSLVHTIAADRDAFFNASERGTQATATNTVLNGSIVRIDLSHIPAGTAATVLYRLVNNDNADGNDTATTVTVSEGTVIAGDLNTPAGAPVAPSIANATGPLDLTTLIDVTSSLSFEYVQTSFNDDTDTLFADVWVTNDSNQPVDGPFVLVVQNLTDPLVAVNNFDGATADGDRFYLLDDLSETGTIQPGETTLARTLSFFNPGESPFDYQLTVLAAPNEAPTFTSTPITLVEAGRPYSYDSNAEDADGDTLTYELLAGPADMTIDSATGEITWSPETADIGNQSVVIKASDGRGAFAEQQFTVEVRDLVPNRPPVIISSPEIQAFVTIESAPGYQYAVRAIDADADPITYILDQAPDGMSIDSATGLIGWNPSADQLGTHTVRVVADDGRGGTATQEYQVVVLSDEGNSAPVIVSDPVEDFFVPGFSNPASGDVSPQRISLDLGNGETFEGTVSITLPDSAARFADIVLAVDESASMSGDQAWVAEMIPLLDAALIAQGIGSTPANPNRFAIIGFGGGRDLITVGHFLNSQSQSKYTLYGPDNTVVATGLFNDVVPDELLNLDLPESGGYVLVIEAQNSEDLAAGIDIGIQGQTSDAVRTETLQLDTIVEDRILVPGQRVEYQFSLTTDTLIYFDTLAKDIRIEWSLNGPNGSITTNVDFNRGVTSIVEVYPLVAGDYQITIDSPTDIPADYKFQVIDLNNAPVVESGATVTGEFELKAETFAYRINGEAGQTFEFVNTTTGVHQGSRWRLLDESGSQLLVNNIGANEAKFVLPSTSEYYLLMESNLSPFEGASQLRVPSTFEFVATINDPVPAIDLNFGETVTGSIDFVGQFVDYAFTLDQRSLLYLDSLSSNRLGWTLTGPRGVEANNIPFGATDSLDNNQPVRDLVAGEYLLRINSNNLVSEFGFRLANLADATEITPGTPFDGELTTPSETDLYRFDTNEGDEFYFDVVSASDVTNTQYKLIDPFGQVVFISNRLNDQATTTIPRSGTYTLLVEGRSTNVDSDTYTFNVVPVVEQEIALTVGSQTNNTLVTPGSRIAYTFAIANDALVYFDSLTNNPSFVWSLDGPAGNEVDARQFTKSDSVDVVAAAVDLRAGSYRLTIQTTGDAVGDFSFALTDLLAAAATSPITPNPGSTNTTVNVSGTIATNESQLFRFNAEAGDQFSFDSSYTGSAGTFYRVVDEFGNETVADTVIILDKANQVFAVGGVYYLLVEGRISNEVASNYSIDINWIQNNGPTFLAGTPLVLNTTVNGDLATPGQIDQYTFTLTDRTLLYLDSLTDNVSIRWNLRGPKGVEVSNRPFSSTDSFNNSNPVGEFVAGEYQLEVYASSGTPGSFGFRLFDLASATPITPETSFSGELDPANETELFKFDATAGDQFYFDVESVTDVTNTQYKLIDPFGEVVFISNRMNDTDLQTVDLAGSYTLLVEGRVSNTGIDTYTMNVHRVVATAPVALAVSEGTTGYIVTPGQSVEYSFTLADRSLLHFDSLTNNASLNWTLAGPSGTIVAARTFDRSDSANFNNPILDLPAGEYSLVVDAIGDLTAEFTFALLNLADATEVFAGAPVVGQMDLLAGSGQTPSSSTKAYRFEAQPGDVVIFDSQGSSNFSVAPYWRLVDQFGDQIFNLGFGFDFGPVTLAGGTYTIFVEGRINDTNVDGEFAFEVILVENELNPTPPVAIVIGETIASETSEIYETDRYAFSLAEQSLIYFDSFTRDSSLVWSLESNGRTLVNSRQFDRSDSSGFATPVLNLQSGEYVLSVFSTQAEPYSFRVLDLGNASPIAIGDTISGSFSTPTETDIFQFSATAGEAIYFDVLATSNAGSAYYRVVNSNGIVQFQQTSITDRDVFEFPADGEYWLLMEGRISQTVEQTYELKLATATVTKSVLTLGETVSDTIAAPGDTIEYAFTVTSDKAVYFDSLTNTGDVVWSLSGSNNDIVSNRAFNASDSSHIASPVIELAVGDYVLTVDGKVDTISEFSFRLLDFNAATLVDLNTSILGELDSPNETDLYQFEAVAGQALLVDVESASDTSNVSYRIIDPLGRIFQQTSLADLETIDLISSGTHYLAIEGKQFNVGDDTYSINIREISVRDEGTIALNSRVSDSIALPGEKVAFAFDIASDSLIHFDSFTNDANLNWTLEGPRGVEVSALSLNRSDSTTTSNTASHQPAFELLAGSYTLTVDGVNGSTGDFGFELINLLDPAQSTLISPTTGNPAIVAGTQTDPLETEVFRFQANAGDQLSFDSTTGTYSSDYRLLDAFGNQIFIKRSNLDQAVTTVELTGTYYLLVEGRISNDTPDTYSITITHEGNTPPPVVTGSALSLGVVQNGDLSVDGQIDSYTFSLTSRSLLYLDSLTNSSVIRWTLTGPRGVEVNDRRFDLTDSFNNANPVLDVLAGDYRLDVFASSGTPGAYGFNLSDLATATEVTPGTSFSGELTTANETDLYRFDAGVGDRFFFDVESASDSTYTQFKLVDRFGQVVFISNRLNDREVVTLERGGTYSLLVEGWHLNTGVDTYTMNVVPFVETVETLTIGASTDATLGTPGEELVYEFSLSESKLLYFDPLSASSQVNWTLADEFATFVDAKRFDFGVEFVELAAGDYTLTVDGLIDFVGDVSFFSFAVAQSTSLATDGSITSTTLDSDNAIQFYQFDGNAGDHFALLPDFNMQFTDSATASNTAGKYISARDPEDGYSGLDVALRADVFREGAAVNYILVTDEDRDVAEDNVTFETLFASLTAQSALLNVVTTAQLRDDTNSRAIGVDSEGNAYIADGAGGFTLGTGGFTTTSNVSFLQDYIPLAWATGGANWDLSLLRGGGINAESFTKAFIDVKVEEILEQTSLQLLASNPNADLTLVDPNTGTYGNIVGGQTYDFDIQIGNDGQPLSFDLLFKQGQTIGSIPVFIASPYGYDAMAVDADGDTLTWSITDGPGGLVVDPATGILAWPADSVVYGQHAVTLRVEDGRGGFDEQTFELDVNGGEAASISGRVLEGGDSGLIGLDALAVNPYSSLLDSPLNTNESFFIEDFEDGTFDLDGVTLSDGVLTSTIFPGAIDSVDGDDGVVDGSGSQGDSWFFANGATGITITFDETVIGEFPKQAGVAWTDGAGSVTFRAFDGLGNLIEENTSFSAGPGNFGQTAEDTFFGVQSASGISSLFVSNSSGGIEIDHIQYSLAPLSTPLEDFTVYMDQNRNGIRDAGEIATATDANGEYLFDSLAAGTYVVTLERQPGWNPVSPNNGVYEVTVQPNQDLRGLIFENEQVSIVNTDPRITSSPNLSLVAGETFEYSPTFEEIDGDDLILDIPLAPAGMAVNPETGKIVWDTDLDDIGSKNVLLRVKDGRGGFDLQYFTINVAQPNTAPSISSTAPVGPAGVGLPYQYNVDAVDVDNDTLTWSLTDAPNGATIDATTGVINWTPTSGQLGSQDFVVNVDDGRGLNDQQTFSVNVEIDPANTDPEILSTPPPEAYLANTYLYRIRATDLNGDPLTFALDASPSGMTLDADGLISWTPTPAQVGGSLVRILVDDGRGGSATQEYSVTVDTQPVNQAPQITSPPKTSAVAGQPYNFQPTADDANNDTLVWELVTGPIGMSINPSTGTLNWLPTTDDLGSEQVVIRVFDTSAAYSELGYTLSVRAVNSPPVIQSVPLTSAAVGATFLYQIQATDADGDLLSYVLTSAPAGMVIDPANGLIQWTPTSGQEGSNAVQVQVSDGNGGTVGQSFTVETAAGVSNTPPTITSTPGFFAGVGDLYSYDVEANDPENAALTYELLQSPTGMTIDANSGLVEWTPTAGNLGTTVVRMIARDPAGAGSIQEYSLMVLAANNAPVINSTPPATVAVGGTYRYDVLATDADGEFLTYELVTAPSGMLIDGVGRIFWVPTTAQTGSNAVEVNVTDPRGGTVTQAFDLTVELDTVDPQVAVLLSRNPVNVGDSIDIRVSAIDNVGVESLSLTLDGVLVALDATGLARVPMNILGSVTAVATATDAAGNNATDTITIFVSDPNDVEGPVLSITSPSDGGIVTGLTDIIGTASDDTLVEYRLLVAEFGTNDYQQIASGDTNVTNAVLGQLDPTLLANGSYILRLEAIDAGGRSNVIQQLVEITSKNKLGNFRVGFTDLVVPVNGIDVVLSRTYDSLNSAQDSDFGFGWRMDFRDVQLQVSLEEASDFDKEYGFYTPYRFGTRVYITLPGGERESFTFNPIAKGLPGLTYYNPRFTADDGVTSTLSVQNAALSYDFGEFTGFGSGQPYNPGAFEFGGKFTLTTQAGLVYTINADTGKVTRIADRNGNRLDFSDTGVVSNSGVSVTFERDATGRITAAVDPDGDRLQYAYNAAGDLVSFTDRNGNVSTYKYEATQSHYLTEVVDPLGNTGIRGEYDGDGRLVSLTDAEGNSLNITTNIDNNTQAVVDELGNQTIYQYDDRGNTTTETNALGHATVSTFDANNNKLTEADPLGRMTTYTYDSFDNILTVTDPAGGTTTFTYADARRGRVATVTDSLGNTTTYTYDSKGNPTSFSDTAGLSSASTYDARGNLSTFGNPVSGTTTFAYDSAGNQTSETDADGNVTTFAYDSDGQLISRTWTQTISGVPQVLTELFERDANGNIVKETNALGHETLFAYDANDRLTTSTDALGRVTRFVYDSTGNLAETVYPDATPADLSDNPRVLMGYDKLGRNVSQTDELGRTTISVYDDIGRAVQQISPDSTPADLADNPRTIMEYDAANQLTAIVNENGDRTEFEYDLAGNRVLSRDALGNETNFEFDDQRRQTKATDALGQEITYAYDDAGRVTMTGFADGTRVRMVYDGSGLLTAQIDQKGNSTSFNYDDRGQLAKVTEANGADTNYEYDEQGNLITLTDANGHQTTYHYDALGRRITVERPIGDSDLKEYDAVGNQIAYTDYNGDRHTFAHDERDRVIRKSIVGDTDVTFTYLANGFVDTVVDGRGTTDYDYDERDRLITQTDPDGSELSYVYDASGNTLAVTTLAGTTSYTYDALNRLQLVTDINGGETDYDYDAIGRRTQAEFANGVIETRSYDALNRVLTLESSFNSTLFDRYTYTYDAKGNRDSVVDVDGRRLAYTYDSLDRLLSESVFLSGDAIVDNLTTFTFDAVGNRLTKTDTADGLTTSTYDADDRLITEVNGGVTTTFAYDANGNRISRSDGTTTTLYEYSGENRLLGVDTDGNGSADVTYEYDAPGNRVSRTESGTTVFYQVDSNQTLPEALVEYSTGGSVITSYTNGSGLISQTRGSATAYYHADAIGTTSKLTDASGVVLNTYIYDAFGGLVAQTGTFENEFLFDGQRRDSTTGLDYLRARNYDASNGRFTSVDPFDGSLNAPITMNNYVYANANPTTFVDPSGNFSVVEFQFVQVTLIDIQKAFVSSGFDGLKRVGRVADHLLVPGTTMQNLGLAMVGSRSTKAALGFKMYTVGAELRAAGFQAIGIALRSIYSDTAKSLVKVKKTFGPVTVEVSILKDEIEFQGRGVKKKFAKESKTDKLIKQYITEMEQLLDVNDLQRFIQKGTGPYEERVDRIAKIADAAISGKVTT